MLMYAVVISAIRLLGSHPADTKIRKLIDVNVCRGHFCYQTAWVILEKGRKQSLDASNEQNMFSFIIVICQCERYMSVCLEGDGVCSCKKRDCSYSKCSV